LNIMSGVKALPLIILAALMELTQSPAGSLQVSNRIGIRLAVDDQNALPALRIFLPAPHDSETGVWVLLPEHVTDLEHGKVEARQLYLFRPGRQSTLTNWHRKGQSLEYEEEFPPGIRMRAQATLEDDGVRYRYDFTNHSESDFDMMQAVTDPRMTSPYFRDVRLERTYVHHSDGFALLAAETPNRVDMPLNEWLPNRYRVSFSWPVEALRMVKQPDGITWYNKSRAVDQPFIATQSTDGQWTIATFSYDPGNVWVNPDLTCQHADQQTPLRRGQSRSIESKTLVIRGNLEAALSKVKQQRTSLQH